VSVYEGHGVTLHHGDCLDVLRSLPDCSIDSVVTDPPYGLEFMGKDWDAPWKSAANSWADRDAEDHAQPENRGQTASPFLAAKVNKFAAGLPFQQWCELWAAECLRVLKPGGHLLAFGGTRTWHRLACAVEDAGFEVRDSIARFHSIDMNNAAQLMEVWQEWTERVPSAGLRFRELGGSSAGDRVLLEPSHDESPARALIADLCSSGHPPTPAETWPSVASNVGAGSTASSALVTIAGASPESRGQQPGTTGSSAPSDAPEWLAASREATTRAAEALRIWLGAKPSSRPGATDALCAALSNALKHITCAHSETFRSYDTTWQTVCVSATTATTTASTAANLLAFTADTLAGLDPEEVMPLEADSGPLAWVYGSGFPRLKSLDVSKAIDKRANVNDETHRRIALVAEVIRTHREAKGMERSAVSLAVVGTPSGACWNWEHQQLPSAEMWPAIKRVLDIPDKFDGLIEGTRAQFIGAEREVIGERTTGLGTGRGAVAYIGDRDNRDVTAPATDAAREWEGWGTALKPAHEPVVWARKPLSAVPLWSEVADLHHMIGGLLWLSLSPAKRAEIASPSSPAEQHEAWCASARVSAATDTSPGGFAETGTCSSPATASTSSSIASSWSAILGALSDPTRTSTTSTRSSTTTALSTLSSLLAPLTSQTTMPRCGCPTSGSTSTAPNAASGSSDEWANWLHTLSASVPASAIEGTALVVASALAQVAASLSADQGAASSAAPSATTGAAASPSPAFEPVVVARKPLIGTVAATVLAHGTGALNIDGCRNALRDDEDADALTARSGGVRGFAGQYVGGTAKGAPPTDLSKGRWPANVILDCEMAKALDEQSGEQRDGVAVNRNKDPRAEKPHEVYGGGWLNGDLPDRTYGGAGGASRFFFVASHDKGDTSALTGKGGRIESCETASTAAESSSPPRQFGDSALGGAVTSEHPDTASQTGSPSTSATPSGSRPSGRPATPTTQNIDAESSPEQQPGERTPTASPASSVGPSAPTVTTTTTTSPSTSAGSAAPATSDTTSQWKALGDTDSAPFKYVAKADATERPRVNGTAHPTVKPLSLMRWLVRLVTPPGGTVLEPFAGSGTTVEACIIEGFDCIAIEKGDEYLPLIMQRIHRRRDPVAAIRQTGDELGLFELDGEGA